MDASALLKDLPVLPVIIMERSEDAPLLARTLHEAGLGAAEVTLRTPAALDAIRAMREAVPELIVGAGSVRLPEDFARIRDAGAQFAVSPGATPALAAAAELPWLPGANTPSECMTLLERGYRFQKFFPAERSGGVDVIHDLHGPLPEVSFCPSGGVTPANAAAYLALPNVRCIGSTWITSEELLDAGDFGQIGKLAREALALAASVAAATEN